MSLADVVNGVTIMRSKNAAQTYRLPADFLFDFCAGFAGSLWKSPNVPPNWCKLLRHASAHWQQGRMALSP